LLKRLIKDSAVYGLASVLARGIGVLLIPLYTRVLDPAEFGVSDIVATAIALTSIVLTLEISQGVMRFYPESRDPERQIAFASSSLWFVVTGHIFFVLLAYPFTSKLSNLLFQTPTYSNFFQIALVTLLFYSLTVLMSIVLRAKLMPIHFSAVNFTFTLTSTLSTVLFVLVYRMGIAGILLGNALGYGLAAGLGVYFARKDLVSRIDLQRLKELISFSAPLVPSSLGYFAMLYVNRFIINYSLSISEVGVYSVAYRLMFPVNLIMNSITNSLTPLIYNRYLDDETPAELARIFHLLSAVSFMTILALSLFSSEILFLMTTSDYYTAAKIIPLLSISAVLSGMNLFAPGLFIANKTKIVSLINISSGTLNIILSFLLVKPMGLTGVALATMFSLLVNFGVSILLSQRHYHIPIDWSKVFVGALTVFSIGLFTSFIVKNDSHPVPEKIFALLICALLFLMFRLIEPKDVVRLLYRMKALLEIKKTNTK
jgi:O-antigen/teichoic acid export membrane protein